MNARLAAAALMVVVACAPAAPPMPAPGPAPAERPTAAPSRALPSTRSQVRFEYSAGPHRYRIVQTISAYRGADTTAPATAMNAAAIVTVSLRRETDALIVVATIDSGGVLTGGADPVQWAGGADTIRAARPRPALSLFCRSDSATVGIARFFAVLPDVLSPGYTARDTLATSACSSSIPVTIDGWTRVAADGSTWPAVRIERGFAVSGAGVSGQHNVRLSGSGESSARVELDAAGGVITRAHETARIVMDVTASGRTLPVVQRTETELVRLQ